ncbi:Chaperone protein like [Actinidia chinensis var. chinensis]|uniref:Chaperone protein like n=1 Tax=Actinidia chinensis var. chinensis TaxID=1590841 RepID=A0A2R6PFJ3_ACTCC|nr:Chaperone protein like [Actinidia chinensis var. chinensis]
MGMMVQTLPLASFSSPRVSKLKDYCYAFERNPLNLQSASYVTLKEPRKNISVTSALVETAASIAVAAAVVSAAATILVRRNKASEETEVPLQTCEECGGSGICSECKGEGFVLKKLSDESAERARLTAKNMATRYTAGLPKKWSYCTKCSSSRSCCTCGGLGKISY